MVRSFYAWNLGVLAYVIVIMVAGWLESSNPAFTIVPGTARNLIYVVRLLTGIAMLAGSVEWLLASFALKAQRPAARTIPISGVKVA